MYQTGGTIKDTLDAMQRNKLVLPAIQREFVWSLEQVCRLFDSLMQGYPFGTFLYWPVQPENSDKFKFYDFVLNYHERDNPHCPELPKMPDQELTAVLDGQQRLTALNIGLRGSMAKKLPHRWRKSPDAFPRRYLYLDLLRKTQEEDEESRYRFDFRTTDKQSTTNGNQECWFRVQDVLSMTGGPPMVKWLNERLQQDQVDLAYEILDRLYRVVHNEKVIAYYEVRDQELEKVLQIFIRMNSGGTVLSYSDLLLSIAVAQWKNDARQEIHSLVNELNRIGVGFSFSKDLVLKAGLMLSGIGNIRFKVENFNRDNMAVFEENWENIKDALIMTVKLVSAFGFSGQNLTAQYAVLPIAYYLYKKNPNQSYSVHSKFASDRDAIRDWLIKSLLKPGIWGSGLDTLLTALRRVIEDNGKNGFPVSQIQEEMRHRGKSLVFEDEELEELVDMDYGNKLTFALMSLIFPSVNLRNRYHIDHIFPKAEFTRRRLAESGVPEIKIEEFMEYRDRLANLQLLLGEENNEKRSKMPDQWLSEQYPDPKDRSEHKDRQLLQDLPMSITEFSKFYEKRRERLKNVIQRLMGRDRK